MELCAAIAGCYLGRVVLAVFPRRVVRVSWRILKDLAILIVCSFILPILCCQVLAVVVTAIIAMVMYNDLPGVWMEVHGKAVVITGCDRGIGQALAIHLDKLGFSVFAGCLDVGGQGERTLVKSASDRLQTFQMDVTNQEQVILGAKFVRDRLNGKVLHGVVNNAGVMTIGNVEVMGYTDIRRMMEVNVIGAIHVYRAFMPLLREGRRSRGRLVVVASNIGLAPGSQFAIYGASKGATYMLSETWRYELKQFNIDVSTIVPSGFLTGIQVYDVEATGSRWWEEASEEVKEYFGKAAFFPMPKAKNYKDYLQPDLSSIVNCMTDALLSSHPKPFYYKGIIARSLPFLYTHLPSCIWDHVMPKMSDFYTWSCRALEEEKESEHIPSSKSQ